MTATTSESHELVKASHDFAVWMIQLADSKAAILVAASAILAGLLVSHAVQTSNGIAQAIFILAVALALASAGLSLATVFPRTTPEEHRSLLYYFAIRQFKSGEDYYTQLQSLKTSELDRELATNTWELADTQSKKYCYLRASVCIFGASLLVTFVAVLLTVYPIT